MISKTGRLLLEERSMEKQGSLTAAGVATAVGVHVAQNLAMQQMIKHMRNGGLLDIAVRASGKPGQGMGTYGKDLVYGVADGLMPEIGILAKKFEDKIGYPLQTVLKKQNLNINNLPKRHELVLGLIGEGRFRDAYRLANTPETREAANTVMGNLFPGSGAIIDQAPAGKKAILEKFRDRLKQNNIEISVDHAKVNKFLEHLEEKYLEDPFTAGIAKAFKENRGAKIKQILKGDDSPGKKLTRQTAKHATRAALVTYEWPTALVNEGKRFMDWEAAGHAVPAIGKLQDWASRRFVTKPMEKALVEGMNGKSMPKYTSPIQIFKDVKDTRAAEGVGAAMRQGGKLLLDMGDSYGFNFMTNRANHLMNTLGLGAAKAGISPELYKQLKADAPKIQKIWREVIEDARMAKQPVIDTTATRVAPKPAIVAQPAPQPPVTSKPAINIPKKKPGFSYLDFSNEMDMGAGIGGLLNKRAALQR